MKTEQTIEWKLTDNRFVAFLDILGFKNMIEQGSSDDIYQMMQYIFDLITSIENESELQLRCFITSDSIVIFTRSNSSLDFATISYSIQKLLFYSILGLPFGDSNSKPIPLKGAIAYGNITVDAENHIYFGKPISDANSLQEDIQFMGLVAHESVKDIQDPIYIKHETPLKGNKFKEYFCVDWANYKYTIPNRQNIMDLFDHYKTQMSGGTRKYIDNTSKYIQKHYTGNLNDTIIPEFKCLQKTFNDNSSDVEWELKTNRFVMFLELITFDEVMSGNTCMIFYDILMKNSEQNEWTKRVIDIMNKGSIKYFVFAKYIVFFTKSDTLEEFKVFSSSLSKYLYLLNLGKIPEIKDSGTRYPSIPLKGAIAYGEITVDYEKNIYFGQPIVDSYLLLSQIEHVGVVAHHTVENYIKVNDAKNQFFYNKYFKEAEILVTFRKNESQMLNHLNLDWVNCQELPTWDLSQNSSTFNFDMKNLKSDQMIWLSSEQNEIRSIVNKYQSVFNKKYAINTTDFIEKMIAMNPNTPKETK